MSDESQIIQVGSLVLQRFEIRERVARGGFAVVWKANDRLLGKDVALKVLQTSIAEDDAAIEEMKRETLRSRELTHPNIVQTYDFVQDGRVVAIAMEFIDGDTMANLAAQRPNGCFNPPDVAGWLADICDALDFAHSERGGKTPVVHHDLKPSNFIVDRYGTAKVLDFGISKNIAETRYQHTGQFAVAGTPPYMSPQQLRGQRPRPSDDIYSFGATVFALLAKKPPFFRGDIPTQIVKEIPPTMNARRTELGIDEPPIPYEWEETIASCLAKDPEKRPRSISEVAVSLGIREPSSRRTTIAVDPSSRRVAPGATDHPSSKRVKAASPDPSSRRIRAADEETARGSFRQRRRAKQLARVGAAFVCATAVAIVFWPTEPVDNAESSPAHAVASASPANTPHAASMLAGPLAPVEADAMGPTLPPSGTPSLTGAAAIRAAVAAKKVEAENEEKVREARRVELHGQVAKAIHESAWREAAPLLAELVKLSPSDREVASWADIVSDQLGVRDVVQGYRMAQEARDADAYASLWAALDDKALRALRDAYAGIHSLTLRIDDLSVKIGGTTATARFRERITFDLRGVGTQTTDAVTVLTLQKSAAGWKIAARDTEQ